MEKLSKVEAHEVALNAANGLLRQGELVAVFDWKEKNTFQVIVKDDFDIESNKKVIPFEYENIDESLFRSSAHVVAIFVAKNEKCIALEHQAVKDSAKVIMDAEHARAMNFKILKGG